MHILIIPPVRYAPSEDPLAGIFQFHQATALHNAGLKVGIISPGPRSLRLLKTEPLWPIKPIESLNESGIPIYRFNGWNWATGKLPFLMQLNYSYIGQILFRKYISENGNPDLIHAHNAIFAGTFGSELSIKYKIPLILTEHSTNFFTGHLNPWLNSQVKRTLKTAKARLVVSVKLGEQLELLYGNAARPWEYVPNVLDKSFETMDFFPNRNDRNKSFHFLNVANLIERKNHTLLLRAFAAAFRYNPAISLRIGGEGPLRHDLEQLATQLGIAKQVTFLGKLNREQVLNEMLNCDAFVLSSNYETFGVVLIEATACGKPVIAISGSGPDCIVKPQNGILVPPQDITALSTALQLMQSQIGQFDSNLIREDCLLRFGARSLTDHLITIYKKALEDNQETK